MGFRLAGWVWILLAALLLAGCGGSDDAPANTAPVARITSATQADAGNPVAASGTTSSDADGDALTYAWSLTAPAGSASRLSAAGTASPSFTPDITGVYLLSLTVNDGEVSSAAATQSVTVKLSDADQAAAQGAGLAASVEASARAVQLKWRDGFPSGTRYRVDGRTASGDFVPLETLSGSPGLGTDLLWRRGPADFTVFRVMALATGRTVQLLTAGGQPTLTIPSLATVPSIVVGGQEPLSGTVRLALSQDPGSSTVEWSLGRRILGTGASASSDIGRGVDWNTVVEGSGNHEVRARWQAAPEVSVEVTRSFSLGNIRPTATVSFETNPANGAVQWVIVQAGSPAGIARVELQVLGSNDPAVVSLPGTPDCNPSCPVSEQFRFVRFEGPGSYTLAIKVVARNDPTNPLELSVPWIVSASPRVAVSATGFNQVKPRDLPLEVSVTVAAGTSTGPLQVSLTLGDRTLDERQLAANTHLQIDQSFDLSSFAPGTYTLSLRARDSAGNTAVDSRPVVVGEAIGAPVVFALEPDSADSFAVLVTADQRRLLYSTRSSPTLRLFDIARNTNLPLADTGWDTGFKTHWRIRGEHVYASGAGAGCARSCVFQWNALDGSVFNLSNASPFSTSSDHPSGRSSDALPWAQGGFVLWHVADRGYLVLYEVATRRYTRIADPQGRPILPEGYFLADKGGVARVVFTTSTPAGGLVQKWSSDTATVTPLSAEGARAFTPKTDGDTVTWQQGTSLLMQAFTGGPVVTLSTRCDGHVLADGVVAWIDRAGPSDSTVHARRTQGAGATLSIANADDLATGGGRVVFSRDDRTFSWNSLTGTTTGLAPFRPFGRALSGRTLYLPVGGRVLEFTLD